MSLSKTAGTHAPHGTDRAIAPHRPVGRWFMHSVVTAGTVTYLGSTFVLDTDVRTTATIVVAAMLLAIAIVYWQRAGRRWRR